MRPEGLGNLIKIIHLIEVTYFFNLSNPSGHTGLNEYIFERVKYVTAPAIVGHLALAVHILVRDLVPRRNHILRQQRRQTSHIYNTRSSIYKVTTS
jgi:hypothetical protein